MYDFYTLLTKRPIQTYLRENQFAPLRALAATRGVSMAELIRQGVDKVLAETTLEEDPLIRIIGIGEGTVTDASERHDDYLYEEYTDLHEDVDLTEHVPPAR